MTALELGDVPRYVFAVHQNYKDGASTNSPGTEVSPLWDSQHHTAIPVMPVSSADNGGDWHSPCKSQGVVVIGQRLTGVKHAGLSLGLGSLTNSSRIRLYVKACLRLIIYQSSR